MVITFSAILIAMMALFRPLQKNKFYVLHAAIVVLAAYYVEQNYFRAPIFAYKTVLLFLVFHLISINFVTIIAYWRDKKAAIAGDWRVPEIDLHMLELLGGWCGAFLAQKLFHHKTKKKSFRAMFWLMLFFQIILIWFILKTLYII